MRRLQGIEWLEQRLVLAAQLQGTVYEDLNSNGIKDGSDNGVPNWAVYLDLNRNGQLEVGEPVAFTNKDGDYTFASVTAGTYRVSEVVQAGWVPTVPESKEVTLPNNKTTTVDFFNFSGGGIAGTVWNDLNSNGVRDTDPATGDFTDPGLANWTVFLDLNNNRTPDAGEPTTQTDTNGAFSFSNLPPGDYEVTEILPSGWQVSGRFDIRQTATVVARTNVIRDFANYSLSNGSIQGTIWNDTNADGSRATDPVTGLFTEPGLADWTVFLDLNRDGVQDPGEPATITDAKGNYSFISLAAGDYEVTEVLPSGWHVSPTYDFRQTVTVFAGAASVAGDFANFSVMNGSVRGTVWNDVNQNGIRDVALSGAYLEPGLANWTIYLDLNRNGALDAGEPTTLTDVNGGYTFTGLQVGDYSVREIVPTGWEVSTTFSVSQTVTVYSGMESVVPDFANYNLSVSVPGSVSGTVWNDLNGNGLRDAGEPGLSSRTIFVDLNGNGTHDATEPSAATSSTGSYTISNLAPGTISIVEQAAVGWQATAPTTAQYSILLKNAQNVTGLDFGNTALKDSTIRGVVFNDANKNGIRDTGERGLAGITVYIDTNNNGSLDAGEPQTVTSANLFYTPAVDEAGTYSFTHLAVGAYTVRMILPQTLSATPAAQLVHAVTLAVAQDLSGIDCAAVFRPNEIHGIKFDDLNGNHQQDPGEPLVANATVFVDLNRNNIDDPGEPTTTTAADGSYSFGGLSAGAYVVREIVSSGYEATYPTTTGGTLWPQGVSNPAVGNVTPPSITASLATGQSLRQTVSITLPNTGALTNMVDVFLLFDDTGSFVNNSPIVRAAFPDIINQLQTSLPGIDLGFGVGRFEEYGNFAFEYATGRPFILNQPIVAASTSGYMTAIQAALNRTTPGYGGDQPETDIEALYQLVTGVGFDGNNNGSALDSGAAGLVSTQLTPGSSGDVPPFSSFTPDATGSVLPAAGNIGGGGFRAGALPIILAATDTGFAYQPKGEASITGVGGLTLPLSALTQTSRPTTPYNSGAGIQQTVTALNALGALVIGLGTNPETTIDPRQDLGSLSRLTGATNQSTATIANGTPTPIAPGDPLYFQIASGFAASVANGVVSAIQNAVTNVAVNITVQASDPRVHIINHTGTAMGVVAGHTASFDIEFVGDGIPHRFDLQFVREGTNVVLGSIPVVLGTPIPGNGYEFEDLEDGQIASGVNFATRALVVANAAPSFIKGADQRVATSSGPQTVPNWATAISPGPASEASQVVNFIVSNDNAALFVTQPAVLPDGTLTFTPAASAFGTATVSVAIHDTGGTANGGVDTSAPQAFTIQVNDPPTASAGGAYRIGAGSSLRLDASASSDPNAASGDSIVSYAWDLNADGQYTDAVSTAAVMTIPYSSVASLGVGSHTIAVRVTDSLGLTSTNSTTLEILGGTISSTAGNDTVRIARDPLNAGRVEVFLGAAGQPASYAVDLSYITQWAVSGGGGQNSLTVDFTNGDPLPSAGLSYVGGTIAAGNVLRIVGTAAQDTVAISPSQVDFTSGGTQKTIAYLNVDQFGFDLGVGPDNLSICAATIRTPSDETISNGTTVTISGGGTLDLAGHLESVAGLHCISGSVINGTLVADAKVVEQGIVGGNLNGNGDLIKSGTGTAILSGTKTYQGKTVVSSGTLVVSTSASLPDGSGLVVGASALLAFGDYPAVTPAPAAIAAPTVMAPTTSLSASSLGASSTTLVAVVACSTLTLDSTSSTPLITAPSIGPGTPDLSTTMLNPASIISFDAPAATASTDPASRTLWEAALVERSSATTIPDVAFAAKRWFLPTVSTPTNRQNSARAQQYQRTVAWLAAVGQRLDSGSTDTRKDPQIAILDTLFAQYGGH